ncbi:MAG: serine--tRNA ligase [Candidatus Saccharibacteria bacterium]
MLDIKFIRENASEVQEKSKQKGYEVDVEQLLGQDELRRNLLKQAEDLRSRRKEFNSQAKGSRPSDEQIQQGKKLREDLEKIETKLSKTDAKFMKLLKAVPNMPLGDVPVGAGENENVVTKTVGQPTKFDFEAKNHAQIADGKDWLDKERAAKVAGSRFAYLKGDLVRMQFAIVQFVINTLSDENKLQEIIDGANLNISPKAFVPVIPPAIVNTVAYEATARLDAENVTYKLADDDMWLNASAEHSLCNMYMNEIIPKSKLPIRYVGYSTSFRREAGTYGKDTEGMFRMHQFDKLEMEVFSDAESGYQEHKFMVAIQEYLVRQLGLPYRVLQKCTADIGHPNAQGVDIEVWMPGQDAYRETHSADYMTDYQARRLQTRYKNEDSGPTQFVHTNDATALVLSRIPVAIIENFQTKDGDVIVPEVLRPFMQGKEKI